MRRNKRLVSSKKDKTAYFKLLYSMRDMALADAVKLVTDYVDTCKILGKRKAKQLWEKCVGEKRFSCFLRSPIGEDDSSTEQIVKLAKKGKSKKWKVKTVSGKTLFRIFDEWNESSTYTDNQDWRGGSGVCLCKFL